MDKSRFINFLTNSNALKVGEFITKSGRRTPYFINTGSIDDGIKLRTLGEFYAEVVYHNFPSVTLLFGPAYKGISLSVITALKLYELYGLNVKVSFNRKEVKDHGEGGVIIGSQITSGDNVVIVEDVITSGISIRESINILRSNGNPKILGVVVSVDRMEKGEGEMLASEEIRKNFGIEVISIVNAYDILNYIKTNKLVEDEVINEIERYLKSV
ncbi:MAG: orotate phosphoribosyltransferase [Spirochaetia bacterium]|nr:orotate phosphoribosyltransferase [Spirochaetota bacterium]MCX8097139.1 orotate phosphoribosyltransferase [Spirochaetota bacterium]MDW8113182.1 orotate phosphoribosyltransferase [Spirochaetia bacterium]